MSERANVLDGKRAERRFWPRKVTTITSEVIIKYSIKSPLDEIENRHFVTVLANPVTAALRFCFFLLHRRAGPSTALFWNCSLSCLFYISPGHERTGRRSAFNIFCSTARMPLFRVLFRDNNARIVQKSRPTASNLQPVSLRL